MIRWVFFLLSFISVNASPKKHNLGICALFKNEAEHLREWIEYHRMVGVDHFYLYDNGSNDQYMKVLRPYLNQKLVTLVKWPDLVSKEEGENLFHWVLSTQVPAYENAIVMHAKKDVNWLVFLDVDEFLVPEKENSLASVLQSYDQEIGVALLSDSYDAASEKGPLLKKFVIESEDLTKEPDKDQRERVRKVIFKPEFYAGSSWAPYECHFKGDKLPTQLDKQTMHINHYAGRKEHSIKSKRKLYVEKPPLEETDAKEVLDAGYNLEDHRKSIHRFLPELARRLNTQ